MRISKIKKLDGVRMNKSVIILMILISFLALKGRLFGQEDQYILGEGKLEIDVYILGEIKNPGKYRVADDTDVAEFMAIAGGPTQFSNLSSIIITRYNTPFFANVGERQSSYSSKKEIIKFNINNYLKKKDSPPAPIVKPGDIVSIPANSWRRWRSVATIIRDVSIVASTYFLYLRATK